MGIEPTWLAWKARALPLSYARLVGLHYSGRRALGPRFCLLCPQNKSSYLFHGYQLVKRARLAICNITTVTTRANPTVKNFKVSDDCIQGS